jgi:hypothetical protein
VGARTSRQSVRVCWMLPSAGGSWRRSTTAADLRMPLTSSCVSVCTAAAGGGVETSRRQVVRC